MYFIHPCRLAVGAYIVTRAKTKSSSKKKTVPYTICIQQVYLWYIILREMAQHRQLQIYLVNKKEKIKLHITWTKMAQLFSINGGSKVRYDFCFAYGCCSILASTTISCMVWLRYIESAHREWNINFTTGQMIPGNVTDDDVINGNMFWVTDHLCWEFTGHRWIPHTKARNSQRWCFFICVWINGLVNNREAGDLGRHRANYDIIVMQMHHIMQYCVDYKSETIYVIR